MWNFMISSVQIIPLRRSVWTIKTKPRFVAAWKNMRIEELRLETEAFCCKNCMNDMEFELILIKVQCQSRIESSHSYYNSNESVKQTSQKGERVGAWSKGLFKRVYYTHKILKHLSEGNDSKGLCKKLALVMACLCFGFHHRPPTSTH